MKDKIKDNMISELKKIKLKWHELKDLHE